MTPCIRSTLTAALTTALVAGLATASPLASAALDDTLKRANALIDAGRIDDARNTLEPLLLERAGQPDYDYLLGLVALESGRPTEAVIALERALAVSPNHLQARAAIARAYLAAGETRQAKQEFENLLAPQVPAEVQATAQRYLDALGQATSTAGTRWRAWAEAGAGHDSNLNSATDQQQIAIPGLPGLATLNAAGVAQSGSVALFGAGVAVASAIDEQLSLIGGASIGQRHSLSRAKSLFDTGHLDGYAGLVLRQDRDTWSAALQAQSFDVDNTRLRDALGLTGQWQRELAPGSRLSAYAQFTALSYPGQRIRDADRSVLGGAWAGTLGGASSSSAPNVFAGLYVGAEREKAQAVPHLGHRLWGLRGGGDTLVADKLRLGVSLSHEQRRYGGPEPLFLAERKDRQTDLRLYLDYALDKHWLITPQIAYTDNASNIAIYDYKRTQALVTVRYSFGN